MLYFLYIGKFISLCFPLSMWRDILQKNTPLLSLLPQSPGEEVYLGQGANDAQPFCLYFHMCIFAGSIHLGLGVYISPGPGGVAFQFTALPETDWRNPSNSEVRYQQSEKDYRSKSSFSNSAFQGAKLIFLFPFVLTFTPIF